MSIDSGLTLTNFMVLSGTKADSQLPGNLFTCGNINIWIADRRCCDVWDILACLLNEILHRRIAFFTKFRMTETLIVNDHVGGGYFRGYGDARCRVLRVYGWDSAHGLAGVGCVQDCRCRGFPAVRCRSGVDHVDVGDLVLVLVVERMG